MTQIKYRKPNVSDAKSICSLVKNNEPLDKNSNYLYVLLCHHFSDTCVVAEMNSKIIGFMTGFIPPKYPQTLFVWQAAVDSEYRNKGIAQNLVSHALDQAGSEIKYVEATVTSSNKASLRFLENLADDLKTKFSLTPLFSTDDLGKEHEPEDLIRIGPISRKFMEVTV
ncbi:MAG: diaminobutyrate acetyltransferase [Candidatus Nitrosomaritimum yanchengensis]